MNTINEQNGADKIICACCGACISEEKGTPYYQVAEENYCEVCMCGFKRRT